MFVWWLVQRAWQPVCKAWSGDISNRLLMMSASAVFVLMFDMILNLVLGRRGDDPFVLATIWIWLIVWSVIGVCQLVKYLSKLHAQYRTEHPDDEKPKRKRKPGDWRKARGCLSDLFEGDDRSSEQIVRDYRDSHEYLEPKPSNFGTILEYFDARVEYHDRDEE